MQLTKRIVYIVFLLLLLQGIAISGTATISWQSNAEADLQGYYVYYGTASRSYELPIPVGNATEHTFDNLADNQTYYFAVTALDNHGNESGYSAEVQKTIAPADTTIPSVQITTPTSASSYETAEAVITLAGTAADDISVQEVTWEMSTGGGGTASGTESWQIAGIALSEGENVITVTANDSAGNQAQSQITVICKPASGNPGTVAVSVSTPAGYEVDTVSLDSVPVYIDRTSWFTEVPQKYLGLPFIRTANEDRGNTNANFLTFTIDRNATLYVCYSASAQSVPNWLSSQFANTGETLSRLYHTWNVWQGKFPTGSVTLGGNMATGASGDGLGMYIVMVGPTDATPQDEIAPTVAIISPTTGSSFETTNSVVDIAGSAADNEGLSQVSWSNDGLGNGTAIGTTSWSANGIPLQAGDNTITVTAVDLSGNEAQATLVVTYTPPDTIAPVVAITSPVNADQHTTENGTIVFSGTAQDDHALEAVTWNCSTGSSGTAAGTTEWTTQAISLAEGLNTITVTATDTDGNTSQDTIAVTYTLPDTADPIVAIASPNGSGSYETDQNTVTLSGSAADNREISKVSWASSTGQSGLAAGLENWTVENIDLQEGTNTITVTAEDAAGNTGSATLTVTYTPPDTSAPTVVITNPSDTLLETTGGAIQIAGTATDNLNVIQVSWSSNSGASGNAAGTNQWSVDAIALQAGTNTLTVTASDAAGNTGAATLTVVYNPPDVTAPTIQIAVPTNAENYTSSEASISLSGTASDNIGLTQVTWASSNGDSGIASGAASWTISGINLAEGNTVVTVTAMDSAGNYASDELTIAYTDTDTTAPTVEITSPTTKKSYFSRTSTLDVGGTAGDDIAIDRVTWQNSRGESGVCSGTNDWQASGISLNRWWNTITITAFDAAGNSQEQTLSVFRWR